MKTQPTNTQESNESPRRIRIKYWCEAELAIYKAIQAVELMEKDAMLTDAQILLQQAQSKVANYVDEIFKYTKWGD